MKYINGQNRNQIFIFPVSIDEGISKDNEVRIIDLFVESLDIKEIGFKVDFGENGRPAYHPAHLLKLYIYGYMNKIRSSRDLEKECKRNIELMWLLKQLTPDHNTISNFRRDNPEAIKKVFKATVTISKHFELLGKKLIAGDSTKLRAQNSKKNNYNQKKIDRHVAYIENKIEEYNQELAKEDCDKPAEIKRKIEKQISRKEKYHQLEQQLQETNQEQISTSDTESRQMIIRNNITEVAYNIQTTVDAKNNLLIDYKVTNNNDSKAMGYMLQRAADILGTTDFAALYDKGYHTGSELKIADDLDVDVLVAIPNVASNAPDLRYNISNFKYNKDTDTYICPANNILQTNGRWYNKNSGKHRENTNIKQYKTRACKTCPEKPLCTRNKDQRIVERNEYSDYVEKNKKRIEQNPDLYKKRQSIVEHPYGTIKRQWGFNYILTKQGKQRASADVGLMFVAYNLRRIISILGNEVFKRYLRILASLILPYISTFINAVKLKIRHFINNFYFYKLSINHFHFSSNRVIFDRNFANNGF